MPQVPYVGVPQVSPQYAPTPSVHSNAGPAAFGAAEAGAGAELGRALGHAGDELFSRAMAMQQLDQQADAINAVSDLTDKIGARLEQFRMLEGKAAKDGYQPFVDDINKLREEGSANLTSEYARKMYLQESRSLQSRTVLSAGAHAGDQFKHYLVGTEQASINTAINNAALHAADDDTFRDSMSKIESSAEMMKTFKGWSDEQAKDFANTQKSKAVFERATNLARTDPREAQRVLDQAVKDGYVSGDDAGRAGAFIRNQRNSVTTRVESAEFLAGAGTHFGSQKVSVERAREAIAGIESGGNYNPPHPAVTHTVNGRKITERALGRYGIMQSNLQPWLKEAGMPAMSEAEFLRDHEAQDKLFAFKFGQYMEEHGSANKAAAVWFTGSPDPDPKSNDGHTTAPEYLKKFNANLARTASGSELDALSRKRAQELIPDDPEFELGFRDRVEAEHAKELRIQREDEFNRRQIIDDAIVPAKDGKLPTSIEEIDDPAVRAAWDNLQPSSRAKYMQIFARNAKGDYAPTEQNQDQYRQWMGRLTDPMASEEDRKKALDADYASMPMPAAQRQQLLQMRAKVFGQSTKNPAVSHAMQVLSPMLNEVGITKKMDEEGYYQFLGTLHMVMEQRMTDTAKPLKDEEIKTIGAGLLREQTVKGWFWNSTEPAFKAEVPEGDRAKIIEAYKEAKGFDPTDQVIQQIYAAHMYNKFYAKKTGTEPKFTSGGL
jgi:hypothetical protein